MVPSSRLQLIVPKLQRGAIGRHLGEEKKLCEFFYWPGHHKDVTSYCNTCKNCAAKKDNGA